MSKQLTTKEFIERAILVHNNRYNYSLVDYKGSYSKIQIICPTHGIFTQKAHKHLEGQGCKKCATDKVKDLTRLSNAEFMRKAISKHGNKYNYSLSEYSSAKEPIKIICPIHGMFEQIASVHLRGKGCPKCAGKLVTTNEFIDRVTIIHQKKYDYSEVIYKSSESKIKIICPTHGMFEQTPNAHLQGCGCPICAKIRQIKLPNDFIDDANLIHDNKFDYSLLEYKNAHVKIKIICPIHGEFEQTPHAHLQGCGCPICKESKGERIIRRLLIKHNVKFIRQYKFDDCKCVKSLPFDFYLPDLNACIEFNGIQHYKPIPNFGGYDEFIGVQKRDNIKRLYCDEKGILLLIIKYDDNPKKILFDNKIIDVL